MSTVAIAIICKTPAASRSKTRLSPPLSPEQCAALSACFIRDVSAAVQRLADGGSVSGYAVYTPPGTQDALRPLLPAGFTLLPQGEGDLGARMLKAVTDLLTRGHDGAVLIGADMPTLPPSILRAAVDAVRRNDCVALGPALDGGYTLIGLARPHGGLFAKMPWGTDAVYRLTLERAHELALPVVALPAWYDVDDASSLAMLKGELRGQRPAFADPGLIAGAAPATREFLRTLP